MVILITVATGQITSTHWNQVGEHRMSGGDQRPANKAELSNFLLNEFRFSHYETEEPGTWKQPNMNPKDSDRALQTQPVTPAIGQMKRALICRLRALTLGLSARLNP